MDECFRARARNNGLECGKAFKLLGDRETQLKNGSPQGARDI